MILFPLPESFLVTIGKTEGRGEIGCEEWSRRLLTHYPSDGEYRVV